MTDTTYVDQLRKTIAGEFYFGTMCRETRRRIAISTDTSKGKLRYSQSGETIVSCRHCGASFGEFAGQNAASSDEQVTEGVASYRVTFNDRLNPMQRFVTIAHELGHIFLGHLGECASGKGNDDESGWPDRRYLSKNEEEIEAEAVAYLVASRAGVIPASAQYIKGYATRADMSKVNLDLVVRSAARIERLAKIRYGSMAFEAPS